MHIVINDNRVINLSTELLYSDYSSGNADIGAVRLKLYSLDFFEHSFTLGNSYYKLTTKDDDTVKTHDSKEIDLTYSYGFNNANWKDKMTLTLFGEFYCFENTDETDMKNVWLKGNKFLTGCKLQFPAALNIYAQFQKNKVDFEFTEVSVSRNVIKLGSDFKLKDAGWKLDFEYKTTELPDSLLDWSNYYKYMDISDGSGRWFDKYTKVNYEDYTILGYKTALKWRSVLSYKLWLFKRACVEACATCAASFPFGSFKSCLAMITCFIIMLIFLMSSFIVCYWIKGN
jgi:hypothetical protein